MTDRLVEIERENWPALRDLYSATSPATNFGYCTVDNYIRWTEQCPELPNLVFYSLNGDWSDGLFVTIHEGCIFTYTLATSGERLERLFRLLDYSKGYKILSINSKDYPFIKSALDANQLKFSFDSKNFLLYLPYEEALKFDSTPSEGVTLKSVEQCDVHIAERVWPHRNDNSLQFLQALACFNPSVGAYDNNGRLIAWVFRMPTGPLGALQVDEEFYGRGLGMLVSKTISRQIAELKQDITSCVFADNVHSLAIFEKLGFKNVDDVHWVGTLPSTSTE